MNDKFASNLLHSKAYLRYSLLPAAHLTIAQFKDIINGKLRYGL